MVVYTMSIVDLPDLEFAFRNISIKKKKLQMIFTNTYICFLKCSESKELQIEMSNNNLVLLFFFFANIYFNTYITIAEFFIIRPQGPNCWKGEGALRLLVRLQNIEEDLNYFFFVSKKNQNLRFSYFYIYLLGTYALTHTH